MEKSGASSPAIVIRKASLADVGLIQHIASLTWPDAYTDILSARQMDYMLDKMYNQTVLEKQMIDEGHLFFIAEQWGTPIGFAGISPYEYQFLDNFPDRELLRPWKLHKLYVLPSIQKSGAGKALMQTVLETIHLNGGNYLLLNVNRNNPAYQYYLKNSFVVLETGDFDIGQGFYMNDFVMGKPV